MAAQLLNIAVNSLSGVQFSGTPQSDLQDFIYKCDNAMSLLTSIDDKGILFKIIINKLSGDASRRVRNREIADWQGLKDFLKSAFVIKKSFSQYQIELNSCKQNYNESVDTFANKVEIALLHLIQT